MIPRTVATQPFTPSRLRVETSLDPPYTGRRAGVFVAYPKGIRVGEAETCGRRAIDRGGASEKAVLALGRPPGGGVARRLRGAAGLVTGRFVRGRRIQGTLQPQRPAALRGGRPDRRHGQAGLPAVVRGRSRELLGLRGRGRERGRRAHGPARTWVVEPFNKSYAPGAKDYDFDINQITITPERERGRGLLRRLLRTTPRACWPWRTPSRRRRPVQDLKDAQLGAQVGTTSLDVHQRDFQPTRSPGSTTPPTTSGPRWRAARSTSSSPTW